MDSNSSLIILFPEIKLLFRDFKEHFLPIYCHVLLLEPSCISRNLLPPFVDVSTFQVTNFLSFVFYTSRANLSILFLCSMLCFYYCIYFDGVVIAAQCTATF